MATRKNQTKTFVIFGGAGAIGRIWLQEFYRAGHNVVISGRTLETLEEAIKGLEPKRVLAVKADASIPAQVMEVLTAAKKKFGRVQVVIISVGSFTQLYQKQFLRDVEEALSAGFRSIFKPAAVVAAVAQDFLLRQRGGWILHVSSHAAFRDLAGNLAYGSFKAAGSRLMANLAAELQGKPVKVTDLKLATVNTPEMQKRLTREEQKLAVQPEKVARWILARLDDPEPPATKLFDSPVRLP